MSVVHSLITIGALVLLIWGITKAVHWELKRVYKLLHPKEDDKQ